MIKQEKLIENILKRKIMNRTEKELTSVEDKLKCR